MQHKKLIIINKLGLHARAAAKFVALTSRYTCSIEIVKHGKRVNGKSIMGVMMLAANRGTEVELFIEGDEEEEALKAIEDLITNRFGEEE
jgi:phosphocarrier protein